MNRTELSIVIPTLNEEKYIGSLLQDVLGSTYKSFEVVVSDSGSEDKTKKIVENFAERYPFIKLVGAGRGAATARNKGVATATGRYILFLDADQSISRTFIESSLSEMKEKNLDIGGFYSKPGEGKFVDQGFWFVCNNFIFRPLQYFYPAATTGSGLVVKKVLHEKIKGFDEEIKVIHDHDYVRRAGRLGKFRMLTSEKSVFNMRRFDEEGRLSVYARYAWLVLYFVFGSKKTPVKYDFGKHSRGKF